MKRYIALLRGVNVSGKNKVPMAELKRGFDALGYSDVVTCLNSGNVAFTCAEEEESALSRAAEAMLMGWFGLEIPVFVIAQEALRGLLTQAPDWWGSEGKEVYDNLIFLLPPLTYAEFCAELGAPKAEYEKAQPCRNAVFWSFDRANYQKTNWWSKTAGPAVRDRITVRTANTVRKLAAL
jgi:uncharacterized protein (DUF1697 family)